MSPAFLLSEMLVRVLWWTVIIALYESFSNAYVHHEMCLDDGTCTGKDGKCMTVPIPNRLKQHHPEHPKHPDFLATKKFARLTNGCSINSSEIVTLNTDDTEDLCGCVRPKMAELMESMVKVDQLEKEDKIQIDELDAKILKLLGRHANKAERRLRQYRSLVSKPAGKKFPCPVGCTKYCQESPNGDGKIGKDFGDIADGLLLNGESCDCCRCSWYEWFWSFSSCTTHEIMYDQWKKQGLLLPCTNPLRMNCGFPRLFEKEHSASGSELSEL